ncbi:MAG: ABC transporter substrate-binding protein [Pseudomonadota bacterium]
MLKLCLRLLLLLAAASALTGAASAELAVKIGYLERVLPPPPVLSNLEEVPEDEGIAGVETALKENNTTGRFLKQKYTLEIRQVDEEGDFVAAARELLAVTPFIVVKAPAKDLVAIADLAEAGNGLLFNASERMIALRQEECRANVLHTIPSRAMLSDALAQLAGKKRWGRWALIEGAHDGDKAFSSAIEASAKKFGLKIVGKKTWAFDADMRRNAQQEVPLFTQELPDHDLLVIADERHDFGRYVMYNTRLPRPVAGSEGVAPAAWAASVEQHGAAQLQKRFREKHKRTMRPVDYAAWAAVRSIGEAVTRTNSGDLERIRDFMLSEKFSLAGFKGRKLTFRTWNGQLRQPIPLTHPRALVALAPLEGYLHQRNELDTLGIDERESACKAFGG